MTDRSMSDPDGTTLARGSSCYGHGPPICAIGIRSADVTNDRLIVIAALLPLAAAGRTQSMNAAGRFSKPAITAST